MDYEAPFIGPDYSQDVSQVSITASRRYMQSKKNLSLITLGVGIQGEISNLPTWTPNLENSKAFKAPLQLMDNNQALPTEFGEQERQLKVTGVTSLALKDL
jgi:hypothetical protein